MKIYLLTILPVLFYTSFLLADLNSYYSQILDSLNDHPELKEMNKKIKRHSQIKQRLHYISTLDTKKFKIRRVTALDNCLYSVGITILDRSTHKELLSEREEGVVFLDQIDFSDIKSFDYQENKNWGNGIKFEKSLNGRKTPLQTYFWTKKSRDRLLKKLKKLIPLCHQRKEILDALNKNNQIDKNSENIFGMPQHNSPGTREVRSGKMNEMSRLLYLGEESFLARMDLIAKAKRTIRLQSLNIFADGSGHAIGNALIKRAREGVQVHVIFDALSNFMYAKNKAISKNTSQLFKNMLAAGVHLYGYRPPHSYSWPIDELKLVKNLHGDIRILNDLYHEKFIIGDNNHLIMGGPNIADFYLGLNPKGSDYWRDQDIEIWGEESDIIQDCINIFDGNEQSLRNNFKHPEERKIFNPYTPGSAQYEDHFQQHSSETYLFPDDEKDKTALEYSINYSNELIDHPLPKPKSYPFIKGRLLQSRAKIYESDIIEAYNHLIQNAKEEIIISNAYFIPDLKIIQALNDAGRRGVKVTILTNSPHTNDDPRMTGLIRRSYKLLVDPTFNKENELNIYEWRGRKEDQQEREYGTTHAKFMVVDKKWIIIGSFNLDPRSLYYDSESAIIVEQPEMANDLYNYFFQHDLLYAEKVSYAQIVEWFYYPSLFQTVYLKFKGFYHKKKMQELFNERRDFWITYLTGDIW